MTVLMAACAFLLAAAVAPATSHAFTNSYCGALINEGTWCGDGSDHTYDYNRASYTGGGSVWVCERLLYANTSSVRSGGPSCAYNYAARNYGSTVSTLFEAEVTHLYSGGARHTIYGYATA